MWWRLVLSLGAAALAAEEVAVNPRWRPLYHLAPPHGWMNDPNGFSYFRNEYHLFYQHNPDSSQGPGIVHWGHAVSDDLFHWKDLPIALYPDKPYDKDGVFSGSAIVFNDSLALLYTGNVNHPGQTPDHEQRQHLAFSRDGISFEKYSGNPVIAGDDHQPDFRDPKVWEHEGVYYTVLGSSTEQRGRALLYSSPDLYDWTEVALIGESDGSLGYNWECPDFFELDGKWVLLMSPQGMEPEGDKYHNLYQTGYIIGDFDYETLEFTPETEFRELDAGHDLYASQTMLTPDGRRVAIAWMDMWESVYPERDDGWTGLMTVPRSLHIVDDVLLQRPLKEIEPLRKATLFSGRAEPGKPLSLQSGAAEIILRTNGSQAELKFEWGGTTHMTISYAEEKVTLVRGNLADDTRRAEWHPKGDIEWRILLDKSSVELFCGEGELTFTSRFFPTGGVSVQAVDHGAPVTLHVHSLSRSVAVIPLSCLILLSPLLTLWKTH